MSARTCVYRCYDARGNLLYVGITEDPARRFVTHEDQSPWYESIQSVTEQWYPTRDEAAHEELRAILGERPRWNIVNALPAVEESETFTGRLTLAIQSAMAASGVGLHALHVATGIPRSTIGRHLRNTGRRWNVAEIAAVANALGTTPTDLILSAEAAA